MDITQWYSIALGCCILGTILFYMMVSLFNIVRKHFLKYIFYHQVPKYLRGSGSTTWFDIILLCIFLTANTLLSSIGVRNLTEFIHRSGSLSLINLIPLFLGGQMNIIVRYCGLGLQSYTRIHRWLGWVFALQGVVHVATGLSTQQINFKASANVAALIAIVILMLILLSSIIRRIMYEAFLTIHIVLAILILPAIYLHHRTSLFSSPTIYLFIVVIIQIVGLLLRCGQILYRNIGSRRQRTSITVHEVKYGMKDGTKSLLEDATHVRVALPRKWKLHPGQYIYLCVPEMSYTSFAQSHPFYIAWSDCENGTEYAVLIIERRKGFTERIFDYREKDPLKAIIEGPFGKELKLDLYGTVILFATGIGIAGQLSYVAHLLEGFNNSEVKSRRISLHWQINSELQSAWVANRMQQLLEDGDHGRILDIHLYVSERFISRTTHPGHHEPLGERIDITYEPMNIGRIMDREIERQQGHMAVSVCTDSETSDIIRRQVRNAQGEISLMELDFKPESGE